MRYGVLRKGSLNGGSCSSDLQSSTEKPGEWYRVGAFFPAPDPAARALDLDLQYGCMLGTSRSATTPPRCRGWWPGPTPAATRRARRPPRPATTPGSVVTWPTPAPGADAFAGVHDLVAKVVGGKVAEGGGRMQGSVSVDVLFAFDSAKVSAAGAGLVARTAAVLAAKADPAAAVQVSHTEAKGSDVYNQKLSLARAQMVAAALSATGSLASFTFRPSGAVCGRQKPSLTRPCGRHRAEGVPGPLGVAG